MPLVFLPQRSGADCDLTALAAIPVHRAFGSMSRELGGLVGTIVLSVSTHSLHWHPGFVCPQLAWGSVACYVHIAWGNCTTPDREKSRPGVKTLSSSLSYPRTPLDDLKIGIGLIAV